MCSTIPNTQNAHLLMFPLPLLGHFIPILDLTHQLLTRGFTITVLVTPNNLSLLEPLLSIHALSLHSLLLSPPDDDDDDDGDDDESLTATIPPGKGIVKKLRGFGELRTPILHWFQSHPSPPTTIVSDFFLGWTHDLACHLGVPRVMFSPSGSFAMSVIDFTWRNLPKKIDPADNNDFMVSFDGIPNSPVWPWWQLSDLYRSYEEGDPDWEFHRSGMLSSKASWGIVFNSFTELERVYIDHFKKEMGHDRVWAVGPLLPFNGSCKSKSQRGGTSSHDVLTWLDQRPYCSVVYVCFGTVVTLTQNQMAALAAGLESSGVHFVWAVKVKQSSDAYVVNDYGEILNGYEDRVADRGFVIKGWAPQVDILKHKAVGAFLTHCGWNSVLEGLSGGVVMLTWPMGADQFTNANLLVDQLGVGVQVAEGTRKIPDSSELARVLVGSIDRARPEKIRAMELSAAALSAVEGGTSEKALEDLVKRLSELKSAKVV